MKTIKLTQTLNNEPILLRFIDILDYTKNDSGTTKVFLKDDDATAINVIESWEYINSIDLDKDNDEIKQNKIMKNFIIEAYHEVYEDNFKEGEGDHVNSYSIENVTIKAEKWQDAVTDFFAKYLFYNFKLEDIEIDEDNESLHYSVTVDNDNAEANEDEIDQWKKGYIDLYTNRITIFVSEKIGVTLN